MRNVLRVLIGCAALAAFALSMATATVQAHPGHKHPLLFGMPASPPDPAALAGLVSNPTGPCGRLYEIRSNGKGGKEQISCTHGPDPAPRGTPPSDTLRSIAELRATSARAPADGRAVTCDGGDSTGMRVAAIYAYPAGQPNRSAAVIPLIREWASLVDDVYYESARETGGSRSIRWLTEPSPGGACQVKVDTLALSATGDDSFVNTLNESAAAGNTSINRRYVIWVDGTNSANICGMGQYWPDDQPGQGNGNNGGVDPGNGTKSTRVDQQCWGRTHQLVEAHELGHNLGAVQASAPNDSGGAHCVDEWDIMCYSDSPLFPAMTYVCGTQAGDSSHDNRLDCNHDDYYHTNPPPGNYLATHWNVANSNFLREGGILHDATTLVTTGDGDAYVEPGESFSFDERIENRANTTATAVSGTLSSPSAHVTPAAGSKAYPNVASQATATNTAPYSGTLSAAATCGDPVPLTVTITSSLGTHQVPATLPTGGPGAYTSSTANPASPIPDGNPAGTSSTTTLAGPGRVFDVNVLVNITHTYDADLRATLTAPDGTSVQLFNGVGINGDNFTNTTLDDEAATAIAAGTAPFTGSFRPAHPLSALDGKNLAGTWTLTVVDNASGDAGTLNSWTASAQGPNCSTPPPAAVRPSHSDGSVRGDFNGDGIGDLAAGAPGEDVGAVVDAGVVHALYGGAGGVSAVGSQQWSQNSGGVTDSAEAGDAFGSTLRAGDFNGDGRDDLAIGVPAEDVGAVADAGSVHVLYGSAGGLTATGSQVWSQNSPGVADASESGDRFGSALAAGRLDSGVFAELVVGVADEDVGAIAGAGVVHVIVGAASGLTATGSQVWGQDSGAIVDSAESADGFGGSVAAADFNGDGRDDLAVGVPGEDVGAAVDGGVVHVLPGSAVGLTATGSQYWSQNTGAIADATETGDRFGSALATGRLNGDAFAELIVGVPDEDVGAIAGAGLVHVIAGSGSGLSAAGSQLWGQDSGAIVDSAEADDGFGKSLSAGDFNGDGRDDLAIGAPDENLGVIVDAGVVHVLLGSAAGVSATGSQYWSQNSGAIGDSSESSDRFGSALAAGKLNSDAFAELIVGVPDEGAGATAGAGVLHVIPGSAGGLTATGSQVWSQDSGGIVDSAETGDGFGAALGA